MIRVDRDTVAQFVIIGAVSVGGWMMLVQPARTKIDRLEAELEAHRPVAAASSGGAFEAVVARMAAVRATVADARRRNGAADDTAGLYGAVMERAAAHGVIVRRLQPGAATAGDRDGGPRVTRVDITAEGPFDAMAMFLDEVTRLHGWIRPTRFTLTPHDAGGPTHVSARFTAEVLAFPLDDALLALEAPDDDA